MSWGGIVNKCQIGVIQSYSPTTITRDTVSVTLTTDIKFKTTTYVTDGTNSLAWSGYTSGSQNPGINLSYDTGEYLMKRITQTVTLQYNTSQTRTLNASLSNLDYAGTTLSASDTITIPARPNPIAIIDSNSYNAQMGSALSITLTNKVSGYKYSIWERMPDGTAGDILLDNVASASVPASISWTPSIATHAAKVTTSTSAVFRLTVDTAEVSTGKYLGSDYVDITLNVPTSVVPTPGTVSIAEGVASVGTVMGAGAYVKTLSKLAVTSPVAGAGIYGSTIVKTEFIYDGVTYNGTSWTSGFLAKSGTMSVTKRVTDSRGRQATVTANANVLDYTPPKITTFDAPRTTPSATTGTATVVLSASSLINSTQRNAISYTIHSRVRGATDWGTAVLNVPASAGIININTSHLLNGPYSTDTSYEFLITTADKFQASTKIYTMPTEIIPLAIGKTGIGVGKAATTGLLYPTGSIEATGNLHVGGEIYELGSKLSTRYANLVSPTFTGTPIVPTPATGTRSEQIASTNFVNNEIDSHLTPVVYNPWWASQNGWSVINNTNIYQVGPLRFMMINMKSPGTDTAITATGSIVIVNLTNPAHLPPIAVTFPWRTTSGRTGVGEINTSGAIAISSPTATTLIANSSLFFTVSFLVP